MFTPAAPLLHAPLQPSDNDLLDNGTAMEIKDMDINPPMYYITHDSLHEPNTSFMRSNSAEFW